MLKPNMPSINDSEESQIPLGLPPIIDTHVHIFPSNIFSAVWKWFDNNAWPIRYKMRSTEIFDFLLSHGIKHVIALQYAHKPGIARQLNNYMATQCQNYSGQVTGMATVYPGEHDAEVILQEAFDAGLNGVKLHAHVQCFDMNSDHMNILYECCRNNNKPIVMHIGQEPKSKAYDCDPYHLCSIEKLEHVLKDFPDLKICVPHLGFNEVPQYRDLTEKHDNLWLDTAMVITDYFLLKEKISLHHYRQDRIMYGSDFPNIPYAWDRELKELRATDIPPQTLKMILHKNAVEFFKIKLLPA